MSSKYPEFVVFLTIFLILLFGTYLLIARGGNGLAKRLMGLFFLALAGTTLDIFFQQKRIYFDYPDIALKTYPFSYSGKLNKMFFQRGMPL